MTWTAVNLYELAYDGTYGCHVLYREDKARRIRYAVRKAIESGNNAGQTAPPAIFTLLMLFTNTRSAGRGSPTRD